ncbi:hypothetical protein LTR09_003886 [Extremus antarcticus]|uniref:Uncharacterized protein n=1 Tax=Extremus antarcticus TaxID=702011 RepID=A0AAJ0GD56_9PEZI|nr:hypothetical protein LTR09_003886 [Extremus antarcticus]
MSANSKGNNGPPHDWKKVDETYKSDNKGSGSKASQESKQDNEASGSAAKDESSEQTAGSQGGKSASGRK